MCIRDRGVSGPRSPILISVGLPRASAAHVHVRLPPVMKYALERARAQRHCPLGEPSESLSVSLRASMATNPIDPVQTAGSPIGSTVDPSQPSDVSWNGTANG